MKRRDLLATAGLGFGTIAGCLAGSEIPGNSNEGGATQAKGSCPEPVDADGVIGESVESEGVEYTIENLYKEDPNENLEGIKRTLAGATFVAVQVSATVKAETRRTLSGRNLLEAYYKGDKMNRVFVPPGEFTIGQKSLITWPEREVTKYPGENVQGAFVFELPAGFNTSDLRLSLWPTDEIRGGGLSDKNAKLNVRGKGEPSQQFCINEEPPEQAQIGESISFGGLRISVVDYTTAKTLNQDGWERKANQGAVFLTPRFTIENISPVPRGLPEPITMSYAGREVRSVSELMFVNFTINGESYTALYQKNRPGRETDGNRIFPGISIKGGLGFMVPENFDRGKLTLNMKIKEKIIPWKA